jgi:hypothetical protein
MARNHQVKSSVGEWPLTNPWPPLIVGLAASALALMLAGWSGTAGVLVRLLIVAVGLLSGAAAVSLRLSFTGWELEERTKSAGLLAVAGLISLLSFEALDAAWDSARLVLGVLTFVTLAGAGLILLPTRVRKVVLVLLVLVHFGGIVTAVTTIPPPGSMAPWLSNQAWVHFYRNYLQFMYLNNAYHFYSPEPGPPTLIWFHLEYSDGSSRWVRIPEREQFRTRMEYQRRLALTESINQLSPTPPGLPDDFARPRMMAGDRFGIPMYPNVILQRQFQEPQPYSKLMLRCYARYAARTFPSETDPEATVEGIKIYRVIHNMLVGPEMAAGKLRPDDPTTYLPYFQGEFDRDGNLKNPHDPFLYWIIPIIREPKPGGIPNPFLPGEAKEAPDFEDLELKDYTKVHAAISAKEMAKFIGTALPR